MELNKKENATSDDADKAEALDDLPVADRQSDETKGGLGHVQAFSGRDSSLIS